jgi:membrane-associated protease RseP (regulator of RpoE activity)
MLAGVALLASVSWVRPAAADTAWLGVYSQQITPELREGLDYNGAGALVTRVLRDSPAERAGIERGDVIVRVGSADVDSPDALSDAVRASTAGRATDVVVVRDGQRRTIRVTLGSRDATDDSQGLETPMPPEPPQMDRDDSDTPEPPVAPGAPRTPRSRIERHGDRDFVFHLPDAATMMGRGRLGVRIESLNPDLASYFGSRDAKGALVLDVTDGSAADKAGIRPGDVITRLDGKSIESAEDLIEAVRSGEGSVSVSLLRHGTKQTVQANLGKAPEIMRFRNGPQGFGWRSDDGKTWMFQGPGANGRKRIVIDGDDGPDADRSPLPRNWKDDGTTRRNQADRESMDQLRDEIQQLRDQLDQLRKELRTNSNR